MKKTLLPSVILSFLLITSLMALEPVTITYDKCYVASDTNLYDSPVKLIWEATPLSSKKYEVKVTVELVDPSFSNAGLRNWNLRFETTDQKTDQFISASGDWDEINTANNNAGFTLGNKGMYYLEFDRASSFTYQAKVVEGSTTITPPTYIYFSGMHVMKRSNGIYNPGGDCMLKYTLVGLTVHTPSSTGGDS